MAKARGKGAPGHNRCNAICDVPDAVERCQDDGLDCDGTVAAVKQPRDVARKEFHVKRRSLDTVARVLGERGDVSA